MCLLATSGVASAFVPPQAFTPVARPQVLSSSHLALSGTPQLNAMHARGFSCHSPSLFPPGAHFPLHPRQELLVAVQDALHTAVLRMGFFCVVQSQSNLGPFIL